MILSNSLKTIFRKMFRRERPQSAWHIEDIANSKWTEDDAAFMFSRKYQEQGLDLAHKSMKHGWYPFVQQQQQMPFGFRFPGYALQTPVVVTWWASSWNSGTTYPAGNGKLPLYNSFVQYQGIIYAIPGTVASTAGTPPPGGVWVVQQTAAPQWVGANPTFRQSTTFVPVTGDFPQPAPGSADVSDATWDFPDQQFLSIGSTNNQSYVPAPGIGFLGPAAAAFGTTQINIAGTWTAEGAAYATTQWIWTCADGLTVRLFNSGATATGLITFFRLRQMIM